MGGLAEEKVPFGGMLGSTFNFVFETITRMGWASPCSTPTRRRIFHLPTH
jgi:hypothetical protein